MDRAEYVFNKYAQEDIPYDATRQAFDEKLSDKNLSDADRAKYQKGKDNYYNEQVAASKKAQETAPIQGAGRTRR